MLKQLKLIKISSSLVAIFCFVLLVFIPLYPKLPAIEIPQTHVRVRLEDFVVFFALLTSLPFLYQERARVFKQPVSQAIIVYWLVGLASTISALFITRLVWPHLAILHFLRRIEYMGLFFLGLLAIRSKKDFRVFLLTFFVVIGLIFLYGLGQRYLSFPAFSTMDAELAKGAPIELTIWTRVSSTFAGHYDLAIFMTLAMPIILAMFFFFKGTIKRAIFLFLFVACYYLLILTASRISFVAYLVSISFLLVLIKRKWWLPPIIFLSLAGSFFSEDISQRFFATIRVRESRVIQKIVTPIESLLSRQKQKEVVQKITPTPTPAIIKEKPEAISPPVEVGPGVVTPGVIPVITPKPIPIVTPIPPPSRQEIIQVGVERSGNIRFQVSWPRAIRHFKKSPLLGTGFSSITLATDNGYLRALGETGILGFLAILGVFLAQIPFYCHYLFLAKPVNRKVKFLVAGLCASTLALLANTIFIDALEASKVAFSYWLILGLFIGRANLETTNENK